MVSGKNGVGRKHKKKKKKKKKRNNGRSVFY